MCVCGGGGGGGGGRRVWMEGENVWTVKAQTSKVPMLHPEKFQKICIALDCISCIFMVENKE